MKFSLSSFTAGLFIGMTGLSTVFAATGLVNNIWKTAQVTPVVLCRYDNVYGFIPKTAPAGPRTPHWKKGQITPIVECRYDNIFNFTPLHSVSSVMAPNWKKEFVTPWVEVVYTRNNEFQSR